MTLTIRQQIAKGSKWKITTDFSAENHLSAEWVWAPDPTPAAPNGRKLVQTKKRMTDFKVGEVFTVTDKSSTHPPRYYSDTKGVFIPLTIEGRGDGVFTLADLTPNMELLEAVEQLIYVFYSPSLGYVQEIPYSAWGDKKESFEEAQKTGGLLFTPKLTKAMKKKRSQDTKQFLLSHSGYYDDIDTSDIYYVFEPGGRKVDFPDDLEIQTIDKATKLVKETFTAKEYLDSAFRLRPLTLKYGGPVRAVFKHMEEKGKDFTTLLMFQDTDNNVSQYDPSMPIKELKEEFKSSKLAKNSYFMKSDMRTVAFAFKNRSDAVMFRLQYTGTLDAKLVDADTLAEVKATA